MSRGPLNYEKRVSLPVSQEQKEEIRWAAIKIGLTLSTFLRMATMKEVARIKKAA